MSNQQPTPQTTQGTNPTPEELERAALHMLAQEATASDDGNNQAQKFCDITIIDLNNREIPIKTVQYEMVFELREYLQSHISTCLHTNFTFEHNGVTLNEYTELSELDLSFNPKIFMRPCKYDDKTARTHIKKLVSLLETPTVLTNNAKVTRKLEETKSGSRSRSASNVSDSPQQEAQPSEQEQKLKQNYEDFMQVIKSHQAQNTPVQVPEKEQTKSQQSLAILKELFAGAISSSNLKKLKHVKCIESIQFSSNNTVTDDRKIQGDLFYLTVRLLENPSYEHGITCTTNGFFRNDSGHTVFSPLPCTKATPSYSYTLVGCLVQLSNSFARNFETYLKSILDTEPFFLTPAPQHQDSWLEQPQSNITVCSADALGQTIVPLYGIDPKQMHDWNEEFQVVRNFPGENFIQRMQRDRAVSKVYGDFVEAATAGAMALIEGKIQPLNPNEPLRQHVYVYNQIFFSFAVDCPTNYKDSTSIDSNPSYTQSNHDLSGLRQLQGIDVPDLYHLATCLVNYCGHRVICQSIIPGILNNNDLSSLAEYGTVDDKKNIVANEEFHRLMLKVAESLNIKVNKVVDASDNSVVEIAGSVEVKGIRGADKRAYIVDLQGLTPRDANYLGDDNHSCLVRPELVGLYQRSKNMEYASAAMKEFTKTLEAKRPELPKAEEGKELADEQKIMLNKLHQDESILKIKEVERLLKEAPRFNFNSNVFKSSVQLSMTAEELTADETLVKELSNFLKKDQINQLVNDLKSGDGVPTDSQSMQDLFHRTGINMRYLGEVLKQLQTEVPEEQVQSKGDFKHLKSIVEREIILRCAKHVFKSYFRDQLQFSTLHLSACVSHLLNMLLCPTPFLHNLNNGTVKFQDDTIQTKFQMSVECNVKEQKLATEQKEAAPVVQAQEQELTKKQAKKLKLKQKKQDEQPKAAAIANQSQKTMSDILFQPSVEAEEFSLSSLFTNSYFAEGLNRVEYSNVLKLTPAQLYAQIREIAEARFGYQLPEQKKLACLGSTFQKASLMRDLCRAIGVQLKSQNYMLTNNVKQIAAYHNEEAQKQVAALKKKPQVTYLYENDITADYKYLPFQPSDVTKIFPVLKQLIFKNQDVKNLMAQANQALKEQHMDKAFELYSQANNLLLQISGPMSEEVSTCITQIASIQFKFGDFLQAIELQTRAIVLLERLMGLDHPQVAYQYSTLAMYYHSCGYFQMSFTYMHRALNILSLVAGDSHPEIASIYLNLGLMYQEVEQQQATVDAYSINLQQNIQMYGEDNIQTATSYQALGQACFRNQDFRKAISSQEGAHKIFKNLFPENSPYITQAKQQLDYYFRLSVSMEKHKQQQQVIAKGGKPAQMIEQQQLIAAIQAAQRRNAEQYKEGAGKDSVKPKAGEEDLQAARVQQQRNVEMNAFQQRYNRLISRINDPKTRTQLDVLEFQAMRERQQQDQLKYAEYAAKVQAAEQEASLKEATPAVEKKEDAPTVEKKE